MGQHVSTLYQAGAAAAAPIAAGFVAYNACAVGFGVGVAKLASRLGQPRRRIGIAGGVALVLTGAAGLLDVGLLSADPADARRIRRDPAVDGPPTTFGVGRLDIASGTVSDVLVREDGMTVVQPRLSPDGSQVAYTRWDEIDDPPTGSAIFVSDLAGGEERQLTEWDLWAAYPDWGPDGTIVFTTYDLGAFQEGTEPANLYTIAPDGSDFRQLTTFGANDTRATQPRWTPDGTGITFTRVDGPGMGTRRMAWIGSDGQGMRFLTPGPGAQGAHPELRPVPEG